MGVGIAEEFEPRLDPARVEPNLARTTLHLVRCVALLLRIRRKRAAEIDQIFVAFVPVIEKREIRNDVVKLRHDVEIGEWAGAGKAAWNKVAWRQYRRAG